MTGFLTKFTLICLFLPCASAACINAQNAAPTIERISASDLSTDEAVIAELQKIKDAKKVVSTGDEKLDAKRKAAGKLDARNVCIERLKETAKIIVIGSFRNDYGCRLEGAFINSTFYTSDETEIHDKALVALGWKTADKPKREQLAALWTEKGVLAFFTVLKTKPKELENQNFQPPQIETGQDGAVKVTLWIQLPSRMNREKGFQHLEYTFAKDGSFTSATTLDAVIAN